MVSAAAQAVMIGLSAVFSSTPWLVLWGFIRGIASQAYFGTGLYFLFDIVMQPYNIWQAITNPEVHGIKPTVQGICSFFMIACVSMVLLGALGVVAAFAAPIVTPILWIAYMAFDSYLKNRYFHDMKRANDMSLEDFDIQKAKARISLVTSITVMASCALLFIPGINALVAGCWIAIGIASFIAKKVAERQIKMRNIPGSTEAERAPCLVEASVEEKAEGVSLKVGLDAPAAGELLAKEPQRRPEDVAFADALHQVLDENDQPSKAEAIEPARGDMPVLKIGLTQPEAAAAAPTTTTTYAKLVTLTTDQPQGSAASVSIKEGRHADTASGLTAENIANIFKARGTARCLPTGGTGDFVYSNGQKSHQMIAGYTSPTFVA